jgi:hypothetical protein
MEVHIDAIADALMDSPLLVVQASSGKPRADLRKVITSHIAENNLKIVEEDDDILPGWDVSDILCQAEEQGDKLTEKEAKEVMENISYGFDACIGVNWDVISMHIDDFVTERDKSNGKTT